MSPAGRKATRSGPEIAGEVIVVVVLTPTYRVDGEKETEGGEGGGVGDGGGAGGQGGAGGSGGGIIGVLPCHAGGGIGGGDSGGGGDGGDGVENGEAASHVRTAPATRPKWASALGSA